MQPSEGPRRRMSREARHAQLLETARLLIRADGSDALTLARIADRAGVAKPLVYQHFGTRTAVLAELYRQFENRQYDALEQALASAPDDLPSVAGIVADAYISCAVAEGIEVPGLVGALDGSPELRRIREEGRRFSDYCRAALQPFARGGVLPGAAMPAILGAADGLVRGVMDGMVAPDEGRAALSEIIVALVPRPD
ncbi:TetR/AcrR family transcriptional regulator [Actinoplanes rectilineatus]|uniref:TetR/AcrR family transcriptional regulator n=1 Tax=Actinoplanes rectilineatus TaxID=113571 RepID=UPI001B802D6D|nr:TetR/AcrR family transcriptional regulator [Actinoplanes rectilineatus]